MRGLLKVWCPSIFDGFEYRTTRVNEAINIMCLIPNKLQGQKKGDKSEFFGHVSTGDPVGTRTLDPLIKSQLLYQLSYGVMLLVYFGLQI
jgi:hypothetical protein